MLCQEYGASALSSDFLKILVLLFNGSLEKMLYITQIKTIKTSPMKKLSVFLSFLFVVMVGHSQPGDLKGFKMAGKKPVITAINQTISQTSELQLFGTAPAKIFGLAVTGQVTFLSDEGVVRVILVDKNYQEYLVYEMYPLMANGSTVNIDELGEETCLLDGVTPKALKVVTENATLKLSSMITASGAPDGLDIRRERLMRQQEQGNQKINKLNENLQSKGMSWVAGETSVSRLSFADRQKLYGQSTFPPGFEFYTGGVIQEGPILKAATASLFIPQWDWRNRHGKDWVTKVTDQGQCGSCWAFAATGATEAAVNLYFNNETIDLDLSEQDVLSCSGAGSCSGGYPDLALNYIAKTGIVDEAAFPYTATNNSCSNKSSSPSEKIKIAGKIAFGSTTYPKTEDNLKKMIIKYGPLSGGVTNWSHALTLVGWKVVAEGDRFYYRNSSGTTGWITVAAGSSLIGTTVWLFKNSWADDWGDNGYLYVQSTISNIGYTYGLLTPVTSVIKTRTQQCVDNDGDGYYWWGTGSKPASCPTCPDTPDGDDSNNALGPLDAYGYCTPIVVVTPPVADFQASPLSIVEGSSVTFTDKSTNTPTSWSWSFNGGTPSSSTSKNPVVTYSTPGTWDVTLVATNSAGTDTETKTGYINVTALPLPVADFSVINTTVTVGTPVTFTDLTTNSPTDWSWTFTGGTPDASTAQNPVITYNILGTFDVSLTAANKTGTGATTTKTAYITVTAIPAPVAAFTASKTSLSRGGSVTFTDQSANGPTAWEWTFEGGTPATSTAQNPSVTYSTEGTYDVTLTVTNGGGDNTLVKTDYITVTNVTYCTSKGNATSEYISSVKLGSTTYTSASSGSAGYMDLTANLFTVTPNTTISVTLTPKITGSFRFEYWGIWIDYNGDGDFADSNEKVLSASFKTGTVTGSFKTPSGLNLTTRMRVSMKRNGTPTSCETFSYGEVKDYSIKIAPASGLKNAVAEIPVEMKLYPNPASQKLTILLDESMTGSTYEVFNSLGMKLTSGIVENSTTTLDLSGYTPGLYLITVESSGVLMKDKFIKR